jgi:hypothetical protein
MNSDVARVRDFAAARQKRAQGVDFSLPVFNIRVINRIGDDNRQAFAEVCQPVGHGVDYVRASKQFFPKRQTLAIRIISAITHVAPIDMSVSGRNSRIPVVRVSFRVSILGHAQVNGRDMCDRRKNPYCRGWTFGEELLDHPDVIAAMTDWLTHICERLPVTVTDPLYFDDIQERQKGLDRLRTFLECDNKTREARDIQFHIFVVRDFDNVFRRYPPEHTDAVLRQSVIRDWVIKISNIKTAKVK